jgi:hypothetical protein
MRFYYPIDNVHFSDFGVPQVFPPSFQCVHIMFSMCSQLVPKIFLMKKIPLFSTCSLQVPKVPNVFPKGGPNSTSLQSHMFGPKSSPFNWMLNHWNMCSELGIEKLLLQVWWKLWFMGEKVKMHVQYFFVKLKDLVGFSWYTDRVFFYKKNWDRRWKCLFRVQNILKWWDEY